MQSYKVKMLGVEVGDRGQTPIPTAKGDPRRHYHIPPAPEQEGTATGREAARQAAQGRCGAGIAAARDQWRRIVAERVALLPPESLGRGSRQ